MLWHETTGGVTAPKGFVAGGLYCGIRKVKKDLAIIRSDVPAAVAGVFTLNKTQAAPITVCKEQLRRSQTCSAVVVNSGNANACTGQRGMQDARTMVSDTAAALGLPEEEVMVSSTGVIGQFMPMDKIADGIRQLAGQLSSEGGSDAAEAILTTDTFPKAIAARCDIGGIPVTIGGIAKGSGMIAPSPSTLVFTKVDETARLGSLINVPVALELPIAALGHGRSLDGDLAPGTRRLIAELVLGLRPPTIDGSRS